MLSLTVTNLTNPNCNSKGNLNPVNPNPNTRYHCEYGTPNSNIT